MCDRCKVSDAIWRDHYESTYPYPMMPVKPGWCMGATHHGWIWLGGKRSWFPLDAWLGKLIRFAEIAELRRKYLA